MTNWEEVLDILNIPYWTSGKNVIPGAVCIQCPCCDDHSHHGNFLPDGGYKCWRCKGAHPARVVAMAGRTTTKAAEELISKYRTHDDVVQVKEEKKNAVQVVVPGSENPLPIHADYLAKRGLDWHILQDRYKIRFTGMGQRSNGIDVSFRVVIPVFSLYGEIIGWQARDVTGRSPYRYIFPKVEDCVEHYKHTLYGAHLLRKADTILVVEGVFDQWKLSLQGLPAVCTFGTSTTPEQVALMAAWKNIIIGFDGEPEAQKHADEIAIQLASMGRNVFIAPTDFGKNPDGTARDFGDLSVDEIQDYKKEIGL